MASTPPSVAPNSPVRDRTTGSVNGYQPKKETDHAGIEAIIFRGAIAEKKELKDMASLLLRKLYQPKKRWTTQIMGSQSFPSSSASKMVFR